MAIVDQVGDEVPGPFVWNLKQIWTNIWYVHVYFLLQFLYFQKLYRHRKIISLSSIISHLDVWSKHVPSGLRAFWFEISFRIHGALKSLKIQRSNSFTDVVYPSLIFVFFWRPLPTQNQSSGTTEWSWFL